MAIMISIQPQQVSKILNGEKTIEIRKTMPKCKLPVKVYIYCTKGKKGLFYATIPPLMALINGSNQSVKTNKLNGKVVACVTLNEVEELTQDYSEWLPKQVYDVTEKQLKDMCLTQSKLWNYGKGKPLYAWHIDDLKIYDTPKELSEFRKDLDCDDYPCNKGTIDCKYSYYDTSEGCWACGIDFDGANCIYKQITRPPQSWFFCEELEEEV